MKCQSGIVMNWNFNDGILPNNVEQTLNSIEVKGAHRFNQGFYYCRVTDKLENAYVEFNSKVYLRVISELLIVHKI